MTLIVGFSVGPQPVLLGDLLLSGPESQVDLNLPTIGESQKVFPAGSGFTITGITQKVNILSENLMIAWAGTRYIAKSILTDLNERIRREPFTIKSLQDYFEDFRRSENRNQVHFVGTFVENTRVLSFAIGGEVVSDPAWGEVRLAGSGTDDVKTFLKNVQPLKLITAGSPEPGLEAVVRAVTLTSQLLQLELQNQSTLLQYYGAGYEIASLVAGRMAKIADVRYLLWEADATGETLQLGQPYYIVKNSYLNGVLAIRSSRLTDKTRDGMPLFDESTHLVEPAFRAISEEDVKAFRSKPPDMNSRFLVNLFLVRYRDGSTEWMNRIDYRATPNTHVVFHEMPDGLGVAIEHSFIESVLAALQQRIETRTRDTDEGVRDPFSRLRPQR